MTLDIEHQSRSTLLIHYFPHYSFGIFGFGLWLLFAVFCLFQGIIVSLAGIILVIFLVGLILFFWRERELWCVINKTTGVMTYTKGGILGSQYDTRNIQYNVKEIVALEMARYVSRTWDKFQIRLVLMGDHQLPLSSANLDFYVCQSFSSEIHRFIGVDIPLRASG